MVLCVGDPEHRPIPRFACGGGEECLCSVQAAPEADETLEITRHAAAVKTRRHVVSVVIIGARQRARSFGIDLNGRCFGGLCR